LELDPQISCVEKLDVVFEVMRLPQEPGRPLWRTKKVTIAFIGKNISGLNPDLD
jgi:hypothetical protein